MSGITDKLLGLRIHCWLVVLCLGGIGLPAVGADTSTAAGPEKRPPNIVLILADDKY